VYCSHRCDAFPADSRHDVAVLAADPLLPRLYGAASQAESVSSRPPRAAPKTNRAAAMSALRAATWQRRSSAQSRVTSKRYSATQSSGSSSGPTACTSSSKAGRRATSISSSAPMAYIRTLVNWCVEDTKRTFSTLRAAARPAFGCRFRDRQVGMPRSARRFDFMTRDR
jgi:L,D-peptidoglycan transpeptidase YkuD (ErfK/YbiS/YcfS/YnhG family)